MGCGLAATALCGLNMKLIYIFLVFNSLLLGQYYNSPEWIINKFFSSEDFEDAQNYYCCEMMEHYSESEHIGKYLSPDIKLSFRNLEKSDSISFFSVSVSDSITTVDWYLYFKKLESNWKLSAIRQLWLPPFYYYMMDSLASMVAVPDSLVEFYEQMKLTTSSDSTIKIYLKENLNDFDLLNEILLKEESITFVSNENNFSPDSIRENIVKEISKKLRLLKIASVSRDVYENEVIFYIIGGLIDNEVGFMYVKEKNKVPKISSSRYIYIENIIGNWYIYKTT